jgi:hypothetical protein
LRRDVVSRFNIALADFVSRNKMINVDGPRALNLNGFKFLVFNNEVLPFRDFIPTGRVLSGDQFAGFGIDILLLQSITSLPIDPVEIDFFAE